jgi:hypothetical protein|tara:strand:+ start:540 stop:668 length:129 start_codon:yes stop_codon:yes gene_type:complete
MTKILTPEKPLLKIPQMDLKYNLKKLAGWRAKQKQKKEQKND